MNNISELVEFVEKFATRIRNGKRIRVKARRKRIITGAEKARRKRGARIAARKRRGQKAAIARKRKRSLDKLKQYCNENHL